MASNRKKDYGSGSFRKRGSKYEYRVSYSDNNRITRSKSFSGRTQRECYKRAEDFFIELERQKLGTDKGNTISAILRTKYQADFEMNFIAEQGYNRNLEWHRKNEDTGEEEIFKEPTIGKLDQKDFYYKFQMKNSNENFITKIILKITHKNLNFITKHIIKITNI